MPISHETTLISHLKTAHRMKENDLMGTAPY